MSDSLDELRRQRELQRERLEWLEREIAAQEGMLEDAAAGEPPELRSAEDRSADQILDEFRQHPALIHKRTKLGCIVYFALAMVILAALVAGIYLHARSAHAPP